MTKLHKYYKLFNVAIGMDNSGLYSLIKEDPMFFTLSNKNNANIEGPLSLRELCEKFDRKPREITVEYLENFRPYLPIPQKGLWKKIGNSMDKDKIGLKDYNTLYSNKRLLLSYGEFKEYIAHKVREMGYNVEQLKTGEMKLDDNDIVRIAIDVINDGFRYYDIVN